MENPFNINQFEIAAGSIIGTSHTKRDQNNQDAFQWAHISNLDETALAGVICDGCGSQPHSEFGAIYGSRLVMNAMTMSLRFGIKNPCSIIEHVLCKELYSLAQNMSSNTDSFIAKHLMFTVIGFFSTENITHIFYLGDGVAYVNGEKLKYPHHKGGGFSVR